MIENTNQIAFLINSLSKGGAERVVATLANEIYRQKIPIILICLEREIKYKIPDGIKLIFLTKLNVKYGSIIKLILLPVLALKLKKVIKKYRINLVQSHVYRANYVNVLSKMLGSKHKVQIVNCGQISRYLKKGLLGRLNCFLIKILYPKADLIILKAEGMKKDMNQLFNFKNTQEVINNPCNIQNILSDTISNSINFSFNINKKYLVSVGRLIALKRNRDLIDAINICGNDKYEILFIGDGEERVNLEIYAKKLKINHRVHFLGQVESPFAYLKRCDLFVSCSESEGFPNVLIESLICGIPVISTDCISGPREILAPGSDINKQLKNEIELAEFGILVPVGKPDKIAEAILTLLNNCKIYQHYCSVGPKRAKDFDINIIVEKYKKVMKIT